MDEREVTIREKLQPLVDAGCIAIHSVYRFAIWYKTNYDPKLRIYKFSSEFTLIDFLRSEPALLRAYYELQQPAKPIAVESPKKSDAQIYEKEKAPGKPVKQVSGRTKEQTQQCSPNSESNDSTQLNQLLEELRADREKDQIILSSLQKQVKRLLVDIQAIRDGRDQDHKTRMDRIFHIYSLGITGFLVLVLTIIITYSTWGLEEQGKRLEVILNSKIDATFTQLQFESLQKQIKDQHNSQQRAANHKGIK